MQCGIERALLNLQGLARDLLDALRDRPPMFGFKRYSLEDQEVEGALDEIGGFRHMHRLSTSVGNRQILELLGGEAGCKRLSTEFYGRVAKEPVLRPLFPGKSVKCAIEEFAAFLIQFLGGDEEQTQRRWWLSLRESHTRFRIIPAERQAWLKHMRETLAVSQLDESTRESLQEFFEHASAYVINEEGAGLGHEELAARWSRQLALDDVITAIAAGRNEEVIAAAPQFRSRPAVFTGLLARMMRSGRAQLNGFVLAELDRDPTLASGRFAGRTLLHYAAGLGCLNVVELLLRLGVDPNVQDSGRHTPLYSVANQCAWETGPAVVQALVQAGADVNACTGVTRATPLHMAARRGFVEIARALLDCGAAIDARDSKGVTPLQRARNCRKPDVARLLHTLDMTS